MTTITRRAALGMLGGAAAGPLFAHSLQEFKDEFYKEEPFVQMFDRPTPDFELSDTSGKLWHPSDFLGKVVILDFIDTHCTDFCPLLSEKLAGVQQSINGTPMKHMVEFVTITANPENDTPDLMNGYFGLHGMDSVNWKFLTIAPGQPLDYTRKLAHAFGSTFTVEKDGSITHDVVVHVIGKFGRWQADFYGMDFKQLSMVMYTNALTNDFEKPAEPGFIEWLWGWL